MHEKEEAQSVCECVFLSLEANLRSLTCRAGWAGWRAEQEEEGGIREREEELPGGATGRKTTAAAVVGRTDGRCAHRTSLFPGVTR